MKKVNVVIVGAGPAGLGCAVLLKQMGISDDDMWVCDAKNIGSTFEAWPKEMRMITPSFPSNGYHQTDLNAITPDTSPAFSLGKEHPSGPEYAEYLRSVAQHYGVSVQENTKIISAQSHARDSFMLTTEKGDKVHTQYLIWAGGEFAAPRLTPFKGSELCLHNSQINSWDDCQEDHYAVIGCYESGVDAAYNLAARGKRVTLIDSGSEQDDTYDPSKVLSPYTSERLASMVNSELVELEQGFKVLEVNTGDNEYQLVSTTGDTLFSKGKPLNCTGFDTNLGPVAHMFERNDKGDPIINKFDESVSRRNLFLTGSKLVHDDIVLCFIYKFRGRFATPCGLIGTELGLDTAILSHYQQAGMLLADLSCCKDQQCHC